MAHPESQTVGLRGSFPVKVKPKETTSSNAQMPKQGQKDHEEIKSDTTEGN